jgi:hypothetical protein
VTAITRVYQQLQSFVTDDDFGRYIETNLRPVQNDPGRRSPDRSSGIHNYIHNRFADSNSDVDMGDPTVNIENERFWRLHGWIDARWTALREAKGFSDSDPAYRTALTEAEHHMGHAMPHPHVAPGKVGVEKSMADRIPTHIRRSIREALFARAAH